MDYSVTFARHFSRLVWLLLNESGSVAEQKAALRATVTQHWQAHGRTQHLLMSFHGIPERYFHKGDPYFCKCQKTARLLADESFRAAANSIRDEIAAMPDPDAVAQDLERRFAA